LITLAKGGMSVADWRDCMRLWIGATEQPFHDFGTIWLFFEHERGRYQVRTDDVHAFFDKVAQARGPKAKAFSDYGKLRGARDLLRMATELGMLSGLLTGANAISLVGLGKRNEVSRRKCIA
jgi:hypothetical protein